MPKGDYETLHKFKSSLAFTFRANTALVTIATPAHMARRWKIVLAVTLLMNNPAHVCNLYPGKGQVD